MANKPKQVDRDRRAKIEEMRKAEQARERRKSMLFVIIAIVVGVGLIAAVLWQADLSRIGDALRNTSPAWFVAAIAINVVATGVMALRWHLLLRARGRREPGLWWLFETYSIVAYIYLILTVSLSLALRGLEQRLRRQHSE